MCGLKRDTPHLGHDDTTCCALTSKYFKSRANLTRRNVGSRGDDRPMVDECEFSSGGHSRTLRFSTGVEFLVKMYFVRDCSFGWMRKKIETEAASIKLKIKKRDNVENIL